MTHLADDPGLEASERIIGRPGPRGDFERSAGTDGTVPCPKTPPAGRASSGIPAVGRLNSVLPQPPSVVAHAQTSPNKSPSPLRSAAETGRRDRFPIRIPPRTARRPNPRPQQRTKTGRKGKFPAQSSAVRGLPASHRTSCGGEKPGAEANFGCSPAADRAGPPPPTKRTWASQPPERNPSCHAAPVQRDAGGTLGLRWQQGSIEMV